MGAEDSLGATKVVAAEAPGSDTLVRQDAPAAGAETETSWKELAAAVARICVIFDTNASRDSLSGSKSFEEASRLLRLKNYSKSEEPFVIPTLDNNGDLTRSEADSPANALKIAAIINREATKNGVAYITAVAGPGTGYPAESYWVTRVKYHPNGITPPETPSTTTEAVAPATPKQPEGSDTFEIRKEAALVVLSQFRNYVRFSRVSGVTETMIKLTKDVEATNGEKSLRQGVSVSACDSQYRNVKGREEAAEVTGAIITAWNIFATEKTVPLSLSSDGYFITVKFV